jgi:hypothetical protein
VNKLVEFLRNEPPPAGGVRLLKPGEFKASFERFHSEELAARRRQ